MTAPRFHLVVAVWGPRFTALFLDDILPTQLSAGNVPAVATEGIYRIYTTRADADVMIAHPHFRRLRALMPVELLALADDGVLARRNSYEVMSLCHKHAIETAARAGAYLIFLPPDAIHSDGTFSALRRRADAGVDMVMISGVRLTLEEALPRLRRDWPARDGVTTLGPRQLVDLIFDHRHVLTHNTEWGRDSFSSRWPSQMFWFHPPWGIIAHCWHLHPLMVRAMPLTSDFQGTIDDDYVALAARVRPVVHVVQDTDEICQVELSAASHQRDLVESRAPYSRAAVARWIGTHVDDVHAGFVRHQLIYKGTGYHPSLDQAGTAAQSVADGLADLYATLKIDKPATFQALPPARRIFLYGTGNFGRRILAAARAAGIDTIRGFLSGSQTDDAEGLPVHSLTHYRDRVRQPGDLVLVTSSYVEEIIPPLRSMGLEPIASAQALLAGLDMAAERLLDFVPVNCPAGPPSNTAALGRTGFESRRSPRPPL